MIHDSATAAPSSIDSFLFEHKRIEKNLAAQNVTWLQQLRTQALKSFIDRGFPKQHDEDWKYTNLQSLIKQNWTFASPDISVAVPEIYKRENQLIFINGHFAPQYSTLSMLPAEVQITNMATALTQQPQLLAPYLGQLTNNDPGFTALNTAFLNDGVFIHVPPNIALTSPLYLLFLTTPQSSPTFNSIRNLIIIEDNSQATIIEDYASVAPNNSFTNALTELLIGKQAVVAHYKLLREDDHQSHHIGTLQVQQQLQSRLTSHSFALGSTLARSDTNVVLAAEHAECLLNGLYLTSNKQHIDHHTKIEHVKPHGISRENYKGVLADASRAVFNGKVIVHPGAYKTDAEQTNKNLLLSNNAEIDTKPQLEIYNDDVRCVHGATIGQLNEDSLFYLRARGITKKSAKQILTQAFIREVLELVSIPCLKMTLENIIHHKTAVLAETDLENF